MASASVFQDEFSCSICLDLLKDPVTVPCGHSFCLNCITGHWDQEDQKGDCSCPDCELTFTPRPVLHKSTMLANVVEKLKNTDPQTDAKIRFYAGPGDVECDFCTGRKLIAIKSCLMCLVSFCEDHIQPHFDVPRFSQHKLVRASSKLQERICSEHDGIIEMFCCTDQKLICVLCSLKDHNGHKTVLPIEEQAEKKKSLVQFKMDNPNGIQQRRQKVMEVKRTLEALVASTQKAVEDTERIFIEQINFLEQKRSEVKEKIRSYEILEVSRGEALLEQLELEISTLNSRDAETAKLQAIEDPIDFLQSYQSLFSSAVANSSSVTFAPNFSFSEMMKPVVLSLRDKTKEFHLAIHKVTGFMNGDIVRLKGSQTYCCYCGHYNCYQSSHRKINSCNVGKVKGFEYDSLTVDFFQQYGWNGHSSQLELVLLLSAEQDNRIPC